MNKRMIFHMIVHCQMIVQVLSLLHLLQLFDPEHERLGVLAAEVPHVCLIVVSDQRRTSQRSCSLGSMGCRSRACARRVDLRPLYLAHYLSWQATLTSDFDICTPLGQRRHKHPTLPKRSWGRRGEVRLASYLQ